MLPCSIRKARIEGAAEIARLTGQLGYATPVESMRARLHRLIDSDNDAVCVADSGDGHLWGWIHGFISPCLESECRVEIGGLVVDNEQQRMGIGRALVREIEEWAASRGVMLTSVRCQTKRADAHLFYESLGYKQVKTQIVFRKTLH